MKRIHRCQTPFLTLLPLLFFLCAAEVWGVNYTWDGSASTDWSTPANWTPNGIPTSGDVVTIPSAPTNQPVISSGSIACDSLAINGTLDLVGGDLTVTTLTNNGTLDLGGNSLTVTTTLINSGTITTSGGTVTVNGTSPPTSIGGTIRYYNATAYSFGNAYTNLIVDSISGTPSFGTLTVSGNLTVSANISGTSAAVTGTSTLGADITTAGSMQAYYDVILDGTTALTLTGAVIFNGTVTRTSGTAQNLKIVGNTFFSGTVDGVSNLEVTGTTDIATTTITTNGDQTYTGNVTLDIYNDKVLTSGTSNAIKFSGTVSGTSGNEKNLKINGNAVFVNNVSNVAQLEVTGGTTINAATVTTTDTQKYTGAVTLGGNVTIDTTANNSDVTFSSTINGTNDLVINAGTADVTFTGAIGGSNAPTKLDLSGTTGTIALNSAGSVTVNGDISFGGNVTTAANTTIATTSSTGTITCSGTITAGTNTLTLKALNNPTPSSPPPPPPPYVVTLNGDVSSGAFTVEASSLSYTTINSNNSAITFTVDAYTAGSINAGTSTFAIAPFTPNKVVVFGDSDYSGAVAGHVYYPSTFPGGVTANGGLIVGNDSFATGTGKIYVTDVASSTYNLTLKNANNSDIEFTGDYTVNAALDKSLTVQPSGNGKIIIDNAAVTINLGTSTTDSILTFNKGVTLNKALSIIANGGIEIKGTVDTYDGTQNLTMKTSPTTGLIQLGGAVGGTNAINNFTIVSAYQVQNTSTTLTDPMLINANLLTLGGSNSGENVTIDTSTRTGIGAVKDITLKLDGLIHTTGRENGINAGAGAVTLSPLTTSPSQTVEYGDVNTSVSTDIYYSSLWKDFTAASFTVGDATTDKIYISATGANTTIFGSNGVPYPLTVQNADVCDIEICGGYKSNGQNLTVQNAGTTTGGNVIFTDSRTVDLAAGVLTILKDTKLSGTTSSTVTLTAKGGISFGTTGITVNIDSANTNLHALTMIAGTNDILVNGAIGVTYPLGAITIKDTSAGDPFSAVKDATFNGEINSSGNFVINHTGRVSFLDNVTADGGFHTQDSAGATTIPTTAFVRIGDIATATPPGNISITTVSSIDIKNDIIILCHFGLNETNTTPGIINTKNIYAHYKTGYADKAWDLTIDSSNGTSHGNITITGDIGKTATVDTLACTEVGTVTITGADITLTNISATPATVPPSFNIWTRPDKIVPADSDIIITGRIIRDASAILAQNITFNTTSATVSSTLYSGSVSVNDIGTNTTPLGIVTVNGAKRYDMSDNIYASLLVFRGNINTAFNPNQKPLPNVEINHTDDISVTPNVQTGVTMLDHTYQNGTNPILTVRQGFLDLDDKGWSMQSGGGGSVPTASGFTGNAGARLVLSRESTDATSNPTLYKSALKTNGNFTTAASFTLDADNSGDSGGESIIKSGGNVNIDGDASSSINELTLIMDGGTSNTNRATLTINEGRYFERDSFTFFKPDNKKYLKNFVIETDTGYTKGYVKVECDLAIGYDWTVPHINSANSTVFSFDPNGKTVQFLETPPSVPGHIEHKISGDNHWFVFVAKTFTGDLLIGSAIPAVYPGPGIDLITGLPTGTTSEMTLRFSNYPDRQWFESKAVIHGYGRNPDPSLSEDYNSGTMHYIKISRLKGPYSNPDRNDASLPRINNDAPMVRPQAPNDAFWYFYISESTDIESVDYIYNYYCFSTIAISVSNHTMSTPYINLTYVSPTDLTVGNPAQSHYCINWKNEKKFIFSFTEDSDENGKIDRIRIQAGTPTKSNFDRFSVVVGGGEYEIDTTKGSNGFEKVYRDTDPNAPDNTYNESDKDSIYVYLVEKTYCDTGARPSVEIIENLSLTDTSPDNVLVGNILTGEPLIPADTAPPRIAYTLAIPEKNEVYIKMSEPVTGITASGILLPHGINWTLSNKLPTAGYVDEFILDTDNAFDANELANGILFDVSFLDGLEDKADIFILPNPDGDTDTPPKYPSNYKFDFENFSPRDTSTDDLFYKLCDEDPRFYSGSNYPPAGGFEFPWPTGIEKPNKFRQKEIAITGGTLRAHRVSDLLIMTHLAGIDDPHLSLWPLYASDSGGIDKVKNGIASIYDGSETIQYTDIVVETIINTNIALTNSPTLIFGCDIDEKFKAAPPLLNVGLWLPHNLNITVADYTEGLELEHESIIDNHFFYKIEKDKIANNSLLEFLFSIPFPSYNPKVIDPDDSFGPLFGVRLDAAPGSIPEDWYKKLQNFKINNKNIKYQRSGATILQNVINPLLGEQTALNYILTKSGQVTVQVFTLDGTLVRTLYRGVRDPGEYTAMWDGKNLGGRAVARGMYFIRIVAPDIDEIRKVMVVK
ncbi:MAG: hypothetical protein Ta2B_02100 [Termitinemataceae bacterium]|nr:MAG: hypothetical protein Ta2B_02100 [Termitinemataceae bacterium]